MWTHQAPFGRKAQPTGTGQHAGHPARCFKTRIQPMPSQTAGTAQHHRISPIQPAAEAAAAHQASQAQPKPGPELQAQCSKEIENSDIDFVFEDQNQPLISWTKLCKPNDIDIKSLMLEVKWSKTVHARPQLHSVNKKSVKTFRFLISRTTRGK